MQASTLRTAFLAALLVRFFPFTLAWPCVHATAILTYDRVMLSLCSMLRMAWRWSWLGVGLGSISWDGCQVLWAQMYMRHVYFWRKGETMNGQVYANSGKQD